MNAFSESYDGLKLDDNNGNESLSFFQRPCDPDARTAVGGLEAYFRAAAEAMKKDPTLAEKIEAERKNIERTLETGIDGIDGLRDLAEQQPYFIRGKNPESYEKSPVDPGQGTVTVEKGSVNLANANVEEVDNKQDGMVLETYSA